MVFEETPLSPHLTAFRLGKPGESRNRKVRNLLNAENQFASHYPGSCCFTSV